MATAPRRNYLVDIDPETFALFSGWPRIRASLIRILTTRLRTRLMRPEWGSSFVDMQDKPGNDQTFTDGIMAAIRAVNRFEPEFKIVSCEISGRSAEGSVTITLSGIDLVEQANRKLSVPI